MSKGLLLITGASGHLGFRVLATALEAGYRVRAPIRREEQIEAIKATKSVQPYIGQLEFIVVPDILKTGAYDAALKGVEYVIHCASPLAIPTDNYERDIIEPAVKGTTGILESALNVPTVKRIVITSSIMGIISTKDNTLWSPERTVTDQDSTPQPSGPYSSGLEAYSASKVFARHATDDFAATRNPHFDIINVMPSYIIGKNELITDLTKIESGTNAYALAPLRGYILQPTIGTSVHVNDLGKIHVLALDDTIVKRDGSAIYDSFLASSGGLQGTAFDDSIEIVKKYFKKEVSEGLFPLGGTLPVLGLQMDSSRTEKVFGFKLAEYEEQVVSLVEHYVELADAAGIKTANDIKK